VQDRIYNTSPDLQGLSRYCSFDAAKLRWSDNRRHIPGGEHQPVASLTLRLVKRHIGPVHHLVYDFPAVTGNGNAEADRDDFPPVWTVEMRYGLVDHGQSEPFADGERGGNDAIVEQNHKFLPTITCDETSVAIVLPQAAAQPAGDPAQAIVASQMALRVIIVLEIIDID
jgi:hypothetical protein